MPVEDIDADALAAGDVEAAYSSCGFQATSLARGISIIREMKAKKATIFLTFTSNLVASGLRGLIAELCKRKFVDAIITAGGSLDHDLIKSAKKYELGSFMMDDAELHKKGINRLGNILVPNACYEYLEKFMQETYEEIYQEGKLASPSAMAAKIGEKIGAKAGKEAEGSFLYWCTKNRIPVFCPGITDSAIGLQAYFFRQKRTDFGIDVTKDMNALAQLALNAEKTGGIILGGGISKHHAIGVNLLRGGFDFAVYVTTSSPWDGSLSGARTNEGISWGKIKEKANHVTIDADATIAFPLLVAPFLKPVQKPLPKPTPKPLPK
jgi:deoxyhypusine synthase